MNTSSLITNIKMFFIGCVLFLLCNVLYAQKTGEKKNILSNKWSIEINGGSTQYWGYINSRNFGTTLKHTPTFGYGLVLTRQISPVWSIRGQFLMGQLKGRKELFSDNDFANLNYFSDFYEGDITAKVSFTDLIKGYKPNRAFTLYGLAGLGFSNFQGETYNYLTGIVVNKFGYGSGKGINGYELDGMGTIGIGMSFKLSKAMNFTFENSMKFIQENKLNERNGTFKFDLYGYSSIGLSYKFGFKKETKKVPVAKNDNQIKPKPVTTEAKPTEVKKDIAPAPVKQEVKKEVPAPAPVKTEQKPEPVQKVILFTGYKVQILATLSPVSFDNIMLQYNLKEQIREDHTDKWYRYSVGEFKSFKEANTYRKILYSRNKIKDAFIVKFVNGKRSGQARK
jgi:hypothetical protein